MITAGSALALQVMAGHLGIVHAAGHSVFITLQGLYHQIPEGIAMSSCSLIGFEIGNGNVTKAKAYTKQFLRMTLFFNILMMMIFYLKSKLIFFIEKDSFREDLNMLTLVSFLVLTFDLWSTVLYGIMRALTFNMEAVYC